MESLRKKIIRTVKKTKPRYYILRLLQKKAKLIWRYKMKKLVTMLLVAAVSLGCFTACGGSDDKTGKGEYTYRGTYALQPSTFNPLTYSSVSDRVPLDYTTSSWYEADYSEDGSTFVYKPVMATEEPVDVTATYKNDAKWGIPEGADTGYAFRIKLNPDAKWDNGVGITAADYEYTVKELLNSKFQNRRGQDLYNSLGMVGAKDYFYSGVQGWFPADTPYSEYTAELDDILVFRLNNGSADTSKYGGKVSSLRAQYGLGGYENAGLTSTQTGGEYILALATAFGAALPENVTAATIDALEEKTLTQIKADPEKKAVLDALIAFWNEGADGVLAFCLANYTYPEASFDNVGFKVIDDYTVDLILNKELIGFYKMYNLGLPLVYKPLYDSLKKAPTAGGLWSTTYGTSVATYMGYGPYKLTKYLDQQVMEFTKSNTWFGFTDKYAEEYGTFVREADGATVSQYQTTKVVLSYVEQISTREEMFLSGKIDVFGMNKTYYDKHKSSTQLYRATGASTFYGIILSNYDDLAIREAAMNGKTIDNSYTLANYKADIASGAVKAKYNKTILSIKEFRQAICYAIDRSTLCSNLYPGGKAAISLFTDLIIADPETSSAVNSYDSVKQGVCEFWGVEYGEGKTFKTLDEAYNSISGYDLTTAKKLVDEAYDKAIAQGLLKADTIIAIDHCSATESESEKQWFTTFKKCYEDLFAGTKLEGKLQYNFNTSLGSDFGGAIQSGKADTSWGFGWSGGELDPYDLMQVYVDAAANSENTYQYDKWINRDGPDYMVKITYDADGDGTAEELEYSVYEWQKILTGQSDTGLNWSYGKVDGSIRAQVLAEMQKKILLDYTTIPMMTEGAVQLLSYKVNYGKENYMFGMGFGGIRYMTHNYDDYDWNRFVKKNGGHLSY